MASKRVAPKATPSASSNPSPLVNAILLVVALSCGIGTLFARGHLTWPPTRLLANLYTVAGCLALIGPILLFRRGSSEVGLGDLLWMSGGLVVWVFDLAAIANGHLRTLSWATPLDYQPMGLTILAVMIAAWRCRVGGSNWSWTNVTGWALGLFWVTMGASTLVPSRVLGVALR